MSTEVARGVLTYDDLPDWELDGLRHELIGGEHIAEPSPIPRHQIVSMNLGRPVGGWVQEKRLGRLMAGPVDESVKVLRLGEGGYRREAELTVEAGDRLSSPLFPGLEVPLAAVFE